MVINWIKMKFGIELLINPACKFINFGYGVSRMYLNPAILPIFQVPFLL